MTPALLQILGFYLEWTSRRMRPGEFVPAGRQQQAMAMIANATGWWARWMHILLPAEPPPGSSGASSSTDQTSVLVLQRIPSAANDPEYSDPEEEGGGAGRTALV